MATIREIADTVGVSPTTVSRVLNNDTKMAVSDETRGKIYATAEELGYNKKRGCSCIKNVAFLYWITEKEELEDIYFRSIKIEMEKQAELNKITMIRYQQSDGIDSVDKKTSAIIAVGKFTEEEIGKMKAITPNVIFTEFNADEGCFDLVRPNLTLMIRQMVDYFVAQGRKNIGYIGACECENNISTKRMEMREKAFRDATCEQSVFNENNIFIADSISVKDGYKIALKAIEKMGDNMPTAFCVASDALAIGALQAFNEKGWSIPQRVSFFSINNINVSKYVSPPLTTFNINITLECQTVFKLLHERLLENRTIPKSTYIAGTPVFRKSTL
jgi:LacI family transcriptional regulator